MSHAARRAGESRLPRRSSQLVAERVHDEADAAAHEPRHEGLVTRAIALAVDAALINAFAIAVAGAVGLVLSVLSVPNGLDGVLLAIGGALFLVWTVAYFVVFWSATGQTPGSRLMGIRVCRADDGTEIAPLRALLRLVGLTLAAIPLLLGFLPVLYDARRRGLHDMLAGTVVVEAPELTRSGSGT